MKKLVFTVAVALAFVLMGQLGGSLGHQQAIDITPGPDSASSLSTNI